MIGNVWGQALQTQEDRARERHNALSAAINFSSGFAMTPIRQLTYPVLKIAAAHRLKLATCDSGKALPPVWKGEDCSATS
jgi:hypothetical protein